MIIENIKTKNFKILSDFSWDLNEGVNLIYGDNGSGKSTLVEIFTFLDETFTRELNLTSHLMPQNPFMLQRKMTTLFQKYATKGIKSHDPIMVKIKYAVGNTKFEYKISLSAKDSIQEEYLHYIKKSGEIEIIFSKNKEKGEYSGKLIEELKTTGNLIAVNVDKKISIVSRLIYLTNQNFSFDKLSSFTSVKHLFAGFLITNEFSRIKYNSEHLNHRLAGGPTETLLLPLQRTAGLSYQHQNDLLKKMSDQAKRFSKLATQFDENIIEVKVEPSKENKDEIRMYFMKMINGKPEPIDFAEESSGTLLFTRYFELFEMIQNKKDKAISVFDEFGSMLHDTLTINIFKELLNINKRQRKQIVITTHSSDLLNIYESKTFDNKNKFVLENNFGKLSMSNLKGTDIKENKKVKFQNGAYGGNNSLQNGLISIDDQK